MATPGDIYRKPRPGDRLNIPARLQAEVIDTVLWRKGKQFDGGANASAIDEDAGIILVRNNSGSNLPQFGVIGIDTPLVTPATGLTNFKSRVVLVGSTPTLSTHFGKFAVVIEPVAASAVGRAVVSGVVQVQLDVQKTADQYADVEDGANDKLKTGGRGSAFILWKESGTGTKWGIVRIGVASPVLVPVDLAQSGGADGTGSTAATWTYTAKYAGTTDDFAGGAVLTVKMQRPKGKTLKAMIGTAWYDSTASEWKLWWCDEQPDKGACS